jgi:hypothetical protein
MSAAAIVCPSWFNNQSIAVPAPTQDAATSFLAPHVVGVPSPCIKQSDVFVLLISRTAVDIDVDVDVDVGDDACGAVALLVEATDLQCLDRIYKANR